MKIQDFVKKAIEQDKRNLFEEYSDEIPSLPVALNDFYSVANPADVEIMMDGNAVKLYPADILEELQTDYILGEERFIFASCNGDPIYLYKDKIYTCCHGSASFDDELMAEDFEIFLGMIN